MVSSTRQAIACIFAIAIGIISVVVVAHAQVTPGKESNGTISGKVTIKGNPAPNVNVAVRLNNQQYQRRRSNPGYKAVTDSDGNYRITNLPAGEYAVSAVAPAYVPTEAYARERVVIVGKDDTVEHVDFALVRGGAITGKVVDAEGRPVVEEQVVVITTGNRNVSGSYSSITDDRGVYRIYGLRSGSYKVAAGRDERNFMQGAVRPFKQTYYPATPDPAEASLIEVSEGSETRDIDIVLSRKLKGFTATGRVVDGETNQPVPNVGYGIVRYYEGGSSSMGWGAVTNARGEFKVENLSAGTYAVSVTPPADADWRVDELRFEIVDQDVTGLVFKTVRSASVSGVVVLEGIDDKVARDQFRRMMIMGYLDNRSSQYRSGSTTVKLNEDGSFQVRGLAAGNVLFYLHSETTVRIDRIERDGVIQPRGIVLREHENVRGVRVIAQIGNATLRGKIEVENGTLPADARFFVWAQRLGDEPGMFRGPGARPQVDARGQFVIEGLVPGDYQLDAGVASPSAKVGYIAKKQVVVTAGITNEVTVTVDLSSTPIKTAP
jgi:uncharacterized protein (DUF2141 family)